LGRPFERLLALRDGGVGGSELSGGGNDGVLRVTPLTGRFCVSSRTTRLRDGVRKGVKLGEPPDSLTEVRTGGDENGYSVCSDCCLGGVGEELN
jgi:hypothetical protein